MSKSDVEYDEQSLTSMRDSLNECTAQETPIDELVEDLRSEFRRGIRRETAMNNAAKRRRTKVMIIGLVALAGAIGTAAVIEIVSHHPNTSRQSH